VATTKKASETRQKNSDEVSITLAHPLRAPYAVRLGLDEKDYEVESTVKLRRDNAQALINAGYAADIDPQDQEAVEETLGEVEGTTGATAGNKSSSSK